MKLSETKSIERFGEMRDLWNQWDPMGLADQNELDIYRSYLGPSLRLLENAASVEDIADYLDDVLDRDMELDEDDIKKANPKRFASKLKKWFENNWPNSIGITDLHDDSSDDDGWRQNPYDN